MLKPPRRGRPPAYDRATALAALTDAFWQTGYSATPLEALAAATAMNRPSLYAAFGDKKAMYLAVLAGYSAAAEAQLRALLWSDDDIGAALDTMFAASVDFYSAGDHGPRGCLAVGTAATEAVADADIRTALDGILALIDRLIAERLAAAITAGQLSPDFDVGGRAAVLAATLHSIATRARAGAPRDALRALGATATSALLA